MGRVYDMIIEIGIPESQEEKQEADPTPRESEGDRRRDWGQGAVHGDDYKSGGDERARDRRMASQERQLIIAREELGQRYGRTDGVARTRTRDKSHGNTTRTGNGDARNKRGRDGEINMWLGKASHKRLRDS